MRFEYDLSRKASALRKGITTNSETIEMVYISDTTLDIAVQEHRTNMVSKQKWYMRRLSIEKEPYFSLAKNWVDNSQVDTETRIH
jgi:hypothetical protein